MCGDFVVVALLLVLLLCVRGAAKNNERAARERAPTEGARECVRLLDFFKVLEVHLNIAQWLFVRNWNTMYVFLPYHTYKHTRRETNDRLFTIP